MTTAEDRPSLKYTILGFFDRAFGFDKIVDTNNSYRGEGLAYLNTGLRIAGLVATAAGTAFAIGLIR